MAQTRSIETLCEPDCTEESILSDLVGTLDIPEGTEIDPADVGTDFIKKVKITITVEEIPQ